MKKKLKSIICLSLSLMISGIAFAQGGTKYGKPFKPSNGIVVSELVSKLGKRNALENIVVMGPIAEVCQAEGCWMKLKNDNGEDLLVKFANHSFLIPKDLAGHHAIVRGKAIKQTVSVKELKHLAEDAGKSADEIAQIKSPKVELRVEAIGVIIE